MPVLFEESPGSVVAAKTVKASSSVFSFGSDTPSEHAIVTGVKFTQKVAAQFKQSLRRILFVFPFGDEPSRISVTLSVFLKDCNGSSIKSIPDILSYYSENKLAPDNQEPLSITIGNSPIKAFLLGMDVTMQTQGLQLISTVQLDLLGWNTNN